MSKVNDEVNEYPKAKEGLHLFKILSVGEPVSTTKSHYRKWIIEVLDEDIRPLHFNLFPWQAKDLLLSLGLGYELKDKKIEWDTDEVVDCKFKAVLTYEKPEGKDKEYPRLAMYQEYLNKKDDTDIPF